MTNLTPEFLAQRRETMLEVLAMMARGETLARPALPPLMISVPKVDTRANRGGSKPKHPRVKLAGMLVKAGSLLAELEVIENSALFTCRRQQYYTLKALIKRHCVQNGFNVPELPSAPASRFEGARPRARVDFRRPRSEPPFGLR